MVDELAGLAKIQVVIGIGNISQQGRMLVEGSKYRRKKRKLTRGQTTICETCGGSDNEALISGGRINSTFELGCTGKGFWDKLNQFVIGVVEEVNAIHNRFDGTTRNFCQCQRYFQGQH